MAIEYNKHLVEALDRILKDIKNNDKLFGGTLLLFTGDFRQTLPVIPRLTKLMKSTLALNYRDCCVMLKKYTDGEHAHSNASESIRRKFL